MLWYMRTHTTNQCNRNDVERKTQIDCWCSHICTHMWTCRHTYKYTHNVFTHIFMHIYVHFCFSLDSVNCGEGEQGQAEQRQGRLPQRGAPCTREAPMAGRQGWGCGGVGSNFLFGNQESSKAHNYLVTAKLLGEHVILYTAVIGVYFKKNFKINQ